MARKKNISDEASEQNHQQQSPPNQHQQSRHHHRSSNKHSHNNRRSNNNSYLEDDDNYPSFLMQLEQLGLEIRDIPGDGNCLFRALGDQLEGSDALHMQHRANVCTYMLEHKEDFAPFVDDSTSFEDYVRELARPGTYAGNDAIVAFARLHKLNIVIHQLNSPPWQIGGGGTNTDSVVMTTGGPNSLQLHLAYHNGEHYSSIRRLGDRSATPAKVSIKFDQAAATPIVGGKSPKSLNSVASAAAISVATGHGGRVGAEPSSSEINSLVADVASRTGCDDVDLIVESLRDLQFDPDETAAYVFQVLESRVDDLVGVDSIEPVVLSQHQQQKQQQQMKRREMKQIKKDRATERHRRSHLQQRSPDDHNVSANPNKTNSGQSESSASLIQAASQLLQL